MLWFGFRKLNIDMGECKICEVRFKTSPFDVGIQGWRSARSVVLSTQIFITIHIDFIKLKAFNLRIRVFKWRSVSFIPLFRVKHSSFREECFFYEEFVGFFRLSIFLVKNPIWLHWKTNQFDGVCTDVVAYCQI